MSSDPAADLQVRALSKQFATVEGPLPILGGVDLLMHRGNALAITGPSGSGKSTLLYIIGLLESPTSGEVTIDGVRPHLLDAAGQAAAGFGEGRSEAVEVDAFHDRALREPGIEASPVCQKNVSSEHEDDGADQDLGRGSGHGR